MGKERRPNIPTPISRKRIREDGLKTALVVAVALTVSLLICAHRITTVQARPFQNAPDRDSQATKQAFADFARRVDGYQKLRSDLEGKLPPLKSTDKPEKILAHEQALAQSIADARKAAARGDIFAGPIEAEFRRLIRNAFVGPKGRALSRTIRQGEPLNLELRVNQVYPATVPVTTVPPTLLQELPKLPRNLEYRVVGRDFVLEDVKSRLVVDFIKDALPSPGP